MTKQNRPTIKKLALSFAEPKEKQASPISIIPCPNCAREGSLREIIYGMPVREFDSEYFEIGGCLVECPLLDILCTSCQWKGGTYELRDNIAPHIYLRSDFIKALGYANQQHQDQLRKKTAIPYISHPLGVASLVLEAGGDEAQAIGGLLHDVAEDCGGQPRLDEIYSVFGVRVGDIVAACSDATPTEGEKKGPYKQRKRMHIAHLKKETNPDVFIVTAADKLHNARAIVNDLEIHGTSVWKRFNAKKPDDIIWYYEEMLNLLRIKEAPEILLKPLHKCISEMKNCIF